VDSFEGTIENIVYYSPDTGYTVLKFVPEEGESMTVIGSFPPIIIFLSCLLRSRESRNFSPQA
jgi:hypothetical protein